METTIKAAVLAKALKARIATLKTERSEALAKFAKDFDAWKTAARKWVVAELPKRIQAARYSDVNNRSYRNNDLNLDDVVLLAGAPKPPQYPSDERLRKVQALLRQLAISGQATMKLSTKEFEEFFGETSASGEED